MNSSEGDHSFEVVDPRYTPEKGLLQNVVAVVPVHKEAALRKEEYVPESRPPAWRSKWVTYGVPIALILSGVAVAVTLTQVNRHSKSPSPEQVVQSTNNGAVPTSAPTSGLDFAAEFIQHALFVCPGRSNLLDNTTAQGQVFSRLVQEYAVLAASSDSPDTESPNYWQEKYALNMLYDSTKGDGWSVNTNWENDQDPCENWYGVTYCGSRSHGQCAVHYLDLTSNNLVGSIPDEICCMPCLELLSVSGNNLTGTVPRCLLTSQIEMSQTKSLNISSR